MNNIKYDASKLFYNLGNSESFIPKINIQQNQKSMLVGAREKARTAIRNAFKDAKKRIKQEWDLLPHQKDMEFFDILPAFWVQGSYSYKTINHPPKNTSHQLDMDDGVYLPMDILEDKPILYKQLFFEIVDEALGKLCFENPSWKFDNSKETCSRIIISPLAHLDFPLYAIPRDEFNQIKTNETVVLNFSFDANNRKFLDSANVYLALRNNKHWVKSDPRKIKNWFENEVNLHEQMLVRVCRYLKAWRDYTWPTNGGPSSIVLMVCVVDTFNCGTNFNNDSSAILHVANNLPKQLSTTIFNPAEERGNEELFPRGLRKESIEELVTKAKELDNKISYALCNAKDSLDSLNSIRAIFGDRIPDNKRLIRTFSGNGGSGLAAPIKVQASVNMPNDIKSGVENKLV